MPTKNGLLCFSPERKCSVFYGAPRKSKLLSTRCALRMSANVLRGETLGRGSGVGRWAWLGPTRSHLGPDFREVPSAAPGPGGVGSRAWRVTAGRLLLSPSGLWSVFPPGPGPDHPQGLLGFGLLLSGRGNLVLCTDLLSLLASDN